MVIHPIASRPTQKTCIKMEDHGKGEIFILWKPESKMREKRTRSQYALLGHVAYDLLLDPLHQIEPA